MSQRSKRKANPGPLADFFTRPMDGRTTARTQPRSLEAWRIPQRIQSAFLPRASRDIIVDVSV
jgi:hypothetical protein